MEHIIENFEAIDPAALNEFRRKIKEVREVEQVYVLEDALEGIMITVIVKEDCQANSAALASQMEKPLEHLPGNGYRVYSFAHAQQELEKGNLYFLKNCGLGNLIYQSPASEVSLCLRNGEADLLLKKAASCLEKEITRILTFTEGIAFYRKRKEWAAAAFLIHQKMEWLYRCLETFAMGKPLICHRIKSHMAYAHPFIYGAGPIFNINSRVDNQLLEVLDRAYTESRYHAVFEITRREIKVLEERARLMEHQVREIFGFRFESCKKRLAKERENRQGIPPEVETDLPGGEEEEKVFRLLRETIAERLTPLKILSFGKRQGYRERQSLAGITENQSFLHYDLLLVAREAAGVYPGTISQQISQKSNGRITTTIIVATPKKVERGLYRGNLFLHRVLKEGTVIYSEPQFSIDIPALEQLSKARIRTMTRAFQVRQNRAHGFLRATSELEGGDDATELSLQYLALQQICLGAIDVMLGLRPDCLKLAYLLDLCSSFSDAPMECFPRKNAEDKRLFYKLSHSVHAVRFRTSDRRALVDVDILLTRSENFIRELVEIVEQKLMELELKIKNGEDED